MKRLSGQPTSGQFKNIIRVLTLVVVILAFVAGYYQSALKVERERYKRYEDMFVRVRSQLGRDEMQRLIDLSYQEKEEEIMDW